LANNLSKVKEKMSKGELLIGTIVSLPDPLISEMLSCCGFDFIWIDGEHGVLDNSDINLHIMAVCRSGLAPFVRVAWTDPVIVKPILDMGPAAVIFPYVRTAEEAKLAVKSCKYPPRGIRGFGPNRANEFSTMDNEEYLNMSESEPWIIIQVEHIDAVNNLKEILKVEGVDSILVGPNDLSGSIGQLGKTRHPEVLKLLDRIADDCNNAGVPFGAEIGLNEENISDWIKRGASFLGINNDTSYIIGGGTNCFKTANEIFRKMKK